MRFRRDAARVLGLVTEEAAAAAAEEGGSERKYGRGGCGARESEMYAGKAGRRGPHRGVGVTRGGQLRRRASGDRALKGPTPHAPSSCQQLSSLPPALPPLSPSPFFLSRLSLFFLFLCFSLSLARSLCWCRKCAFKVFPFWSFSVLFLSPFLSLLLLRSRARAFISRSLISANLSTRRREFSRLSPGFSG